MTRPLDRLLRPKSIAVIGGGAWCASVVGQCSKMGFSGAVWPVHPTRPEIGGARAFADVAALPGVPDAAFIGVNRHATIDVIGQLAAVGAGGAVCFASGFREADAETGEGQTLQDRLVQAADDMPILGPNCYGFINYLDGALLWPDQHGGTRCDRGVAIVTQSSNIAINLTMQRRGLPLAFVVTVGNQAQTDLATIGRALVLDPRITALGLHIEGVGDLRGFEALAAEARAAGKPVVVLKAGRSEQARAAAVSHTASLAGHDAGARALFRRLGMARVDSLTAFLETLKLLHLAGPMPSNRIVSMSCSGGEASLVADSAQGRDLVFATLETDRRAALRATLGPLVTLANPLDYHTFIWDDVPAMTATFTEMLKTPCAIGCLIVDFPRPDRCSAQAWECTITAGAAAAQATGRPLAMVATLPEALPEDMALRMTSAGLIPLAGLDDALTAIEAAAMLGAAADLPAPLTLPGDVGGSGSGILWSEHAAKAALAVHGLAVPAGGRADTAEAAADMADRIGYPVALKGMGQAHKTEAGLVALGLSDRAAVVAAAKRMSADEYLVEEMVGDHGIDLLVGVLRDPAHGFMLTLAAGGILTEVMADSVVLLLPVTAADIAAALDDLRVATLLAGYRGRPACDRAAIIAAVEAVQAFVIGNADRVEEVEINPLICRPDGAVAVDALIRERGQP